MINRVILTGYLAKDIEIRYTPSGVQTATFHLGVSRGKDKDTDFIQCVAWRQSADFLGQYASKGDLLGIDGKIYTRTYEGKHGNVYITEVNCESVQILRKKEAPKEETKEDIMDDPSFKTKDINEDTSDLPFY